MGKKTKYDVFISEYDCPFEKIAGFGKVSLLDCSKKKRPIMTEGLFFHKGKEK